MFHFELARVPVLMSLVRPIRLRSENWGFIYTCISVFCSDFLVLNLLVWMSYRM